MKQDFGVSEAVSFIFVLLILLMAVSGILLYGVPYIEDKKSAAESVAVMQQFSSILSGMDELVLAEAYGVERNAVFPAQYGTLSLSSGFDRRFTLTYDSTSSKDAVFENGVLSRGEYTVLSASGYLPVTDAAACAVQKKTAVFSYSLLRIYEKNGITYAEFSVRLV